MSDVMKEIKIEKITFNIGAGKDQGLLEKGIMLLQNLTGIPPVKTVTKKRIPSWGLRPGLPVGAKITIRNQEQIKSLLTRCLKAKANKLSKSCFDNNGNISFGIHEYIDIPDLEYDPKIGIIGFQICVKLKRPGFSIEKRYVEKKKIGKKHLIKSEDSINFMNKEYGLEVQD
jgi:large subunit ribosomal protein L5